MHTIQPARQFIEILQHLGLPQAIKNVQTEVELLSIDNQLVPITINQAEYSNSYVCSPYTAYISYAESELGLIKSKSQRRLFKSLIKLADYGLRFAKINRTLSINNWLVSTNLPPNWSAETIKKLTLPLLERYPNHSYHIRSLNNVNHKGLLTALKQAGWLIIPARQVYLFDNQQRAWWKRSHTKRDQAFLRKTKLIKVLPAEHQEVDFIEICDCFTQLYIKKHSSYNPQFSAAFLFEMHNNGLLEFHSFRDPATTKIIASIAFFTQQEIITTPMVGYDIAQPKELGLYRLLMAVLLKHTYESGQQMNLSSGAASFKLARGGKATMEYTAFYCQHLPCSQQLIMTGFAKILNRFAPKVFENNQI